jgi:hypothetical protein
VAVEQAGRRDKAQRRGQFPVCFQS